MSGLRTFIFRSKTFILLLSFLCFFETYFSAFFSSLVKASVSSSLSYFFLFSSAAGAFTGVVKCSKTCLNSATCYKNNLIIRNSYSPTSYSWLVHPNIFDLEHFRSISRVLFVLFFELDRGYHWLEIFVKSLEFILYDILLGLTLGFSGLFNL